MSGLAREVHYRYLMHPTVPVTEERRTGATIPGTIGFDLYVALLAPRTALQSPRLPKDLS